MTAKTKSNQTIKPFFTAAIVTLSIAAFSGITPPAAHAQNAPTVTVDQSPVNFSGQPPVQSGGRILVPLRGVLEKLGAYVGFDNRSQTVTAFRGATRITLPIGGRQALINDRAVTLDAPARVVNGSTLVPLRFVAEALGAQVSYDVNTNTVAIASGANAAGGTPVANTTSPPNAVVADLTSLSGIVSAVYPNTSPPRLVLRVGSSNGDAREQTIPLKADAKITVQKNGKADPIITLNRVRVGDQVAVMENGAGQAIAVSVTARAAALQKQTGTTTVTPVTPATGSATTFKGEFLDSDKKNGYYVLKMTDGRSIDVEDDAAIVWQNQKIGPDDLRSGDMITVTLDPKSKRGTRVAVSDPSLN